MTTKHTLGPWTAEREAGVGYIIAENGVTIPNHYEEYEADANLIAAAPDLLGLAKLFRSYLKSGVAVDMPKPNGYSVGDLMNAVRTAIAKAEGK